MSRLMRFTLYAALWLILTSNDPMAWAPGMLASAAATALSLRLLPSRGASRPRILSIVSLAPGFFWGSLLGGVDVARRAFHPRAPLRPGWIHYPVRLPPGGPRVALGGELSLMPGTLAAGAGAGGDVVYVHCLDCERPIVEAVAREEIRIARAIGLNFGGHRG